MEKHPHLHLFDESITWRVLIVGTFPPNGSLRDNLYIDYFYGNKGFLWRIIHDIYKDCGYDFMSGDKNEKLSEIRRWQHDYCVGLSDTILSCIRKDPKSSQDADLLDIRYNFALRDYILNNAQDLEKIIFTSSYGKNSAFENFRVIMQDDLEAIRDKLITGLPSPSGSANITFFNTGNAETLGLTTDFYLFVKDLRPELLDFFAERWKLKQQKRSAPQTDREKIIIPATPQGLVTAYKLHRYREALPKNKCRSK